MSKVTDAGGLLTDLEESLRIIDAVAKLRLRMGQDREADSIMFHFLGSQLRDSRERAYGAFEGLHGLNRGERLRAS